MQAPQRLTVHDISRPSRWDGPTMLQIVRDMGIDVNAERLIEKESLRDFQECLALVLYWNDDSGSGCVTQKLRPCGGAFLFWRQYVGVRMCIPSKLLWWTHKQPAAATSPNASPKSRLPTEQAGPSRCIRLWGTR